VKAIEVVRPGTLTTLQDWPGRLGRWGVGVPPSGPMDDRAFRAGNLLVGNAEGAPGLEVTLRGPKLRFARPATVAVTGPPLPVELDGRPVEQWAPIDVPAGGELDTGAIRGTGMRAYVLVGGGLEGDELMGSRATFTLGGLGGIEGRALRRGDVLRVGPAGGGAPAQVAVRVPEYGNAWTLRVVRGPHGAPDFLTARGLEELFAAEWTVHHHSGRSGIRLVGPLPEWARADGGEAGLHPSNILDSAYGVGALMLAGDMAVIVGPDGPSLGGFVAVAQVVREDMWKLGQLRAGDTVRLAAERVAPGLRAPADGEHGSVTYRRAGERGLLVEFGAPELDLRSRVRVHALAEALAVERLAGVIDLTPGVRSLHVAFEPALLPLGRLLEAVARVEAELSDPATLVVDARTVELPLAWRHSQAMLAVERYARSVRADAPWCPDNIEFIRRINGLPDEQAVKRIVLDASYLVLGLGDVYLGAPVAVPLDPRHRLVTTKYTPARTWTPANAVGIGGAFMCVYGVEGPGGYQLVGRTVPIWHDAAEPPWLLRPFDRIRFVPVDENELEELRAASLAGAWAPATAPAPFCLGDHERALAPHAAEIAAFRARREEAFLAEREAWEAAAA
jgi:urea carboxylase